MTIFIWVIAILFVTDVIGKAVMISKQEYTRTANSMILNITITLCLLVWAVWLLGNNA